jgi:hypothetical protein
MLALEESLPRADHVLEEVVKETGATGLFTGFPQEH